MNPRLLIIASAAAVGLGYWLMNKNKANKETDNGSDPEKCGRSAPGHLGVPAHPDDARRVTEPVPATEPTPGAS